MRLLAVFKEWFCTACRRWVRAEGRESWRACPKCGQRGHLVSHSKPLSRRTQVGMFCVERTRTSSGSLPCTIRGMYQGPDGRYRCPGHELERVQAGGAPATNRELH